MNFGQALLIALLSSVIAASVALLVAWWNRRNQVSDRESERELAAESQKRADREKSEAAQREELARVESANREERAKHHQRHKRDYDTAHSALDQVAGICTSVDESPLTTADLEKLDIESIRHELKRLGSKSSKIEGSFEALGSWLKNVNIPVDRQGDDCLQAARRAHRQLKASLVVRELLVRAYEKVDAEWGP
ncbi:hypothetical protein AB0A73_10265 [Glycomyces sp. NPDC047369]